MKSTGATYALKQTFKVDAITKNAMRYVYAERKSLQACDHPLIVKLYGSFQDAHSIYLVLEYVPGGDLDWFAQEKDKGRFDEDDAQFYAAEILCALEYMHSAGFMHRDVKPENVLIDAGGHTKLADFGFARAVDKNGRCFTNLGTPHYLAPEQLDIHSKVGYTHIVDWWSWACLVYNLLHGEPPFGTSEDTRYEVYLRVMKSKYKVPGHFSKDAKSLVKKMFVAKAEKRLCEVSAIKSHNFFSSISSWEAIGNRQVAAPEVRTIRKNGKSNFTKIKIAAKDSPDHMRKVMKHAEKFYDF